MVAVLSSSVGNQRTVLIDISRTGACLGGLSLPATGQDVILTALGVHAAGEAIRSEACRCAIEFETPIAAEEVCRIRSLGSLKN
jgi:hypothetical protein